MIIMTNTQAITFLHKHSRMLPMSKWTLKNELKIIFSSKSSWILDDRLRLYVGNGWSGSIQNCWIVSPDIIHGSKIDVYASNLSEKITKLTKARWKYCHLGSVRQVQLWSVSQVFSEYSIPKIMILNNFKSIQIYNVHIIDLYHSINN